MAAILTSDDRRLRDLRVPGRGESRDITFGPKCLRSVVHGMHWEPDVKCRVLASHVVAVEEILGGGRSRESQKHGFSVHRFQIFHVVSDPISDPV